MATFTMRPSAGLTTGMSVAVKDVIPELVEKTARNVSWNHLSKAPENFGKKQVGTQLKDIFVMPAHGNTPERDIEFKAGFQMKQEGGQQKWEGNAVVGNIRLDLQGIENNWANFAIQIKKQGGGSDTVATCLMQVNQCFSQGQLIKALRRSAYEGQICELTM